MLDPAERIVAENRITPHRAPMRQLFANHSPYDAIALLGYLIFETMARFPTEDQAQILRWLSLDAVYADFDS